MSADRPLVSVRNLRKTFAVNRGLVFRRRVGDVVAVDDVSFDIRDGEVLGLVGASGSGKSTIGRLILRLLEADSGQVLFGGRDIVGLGGGDMRQVRRDMQIVFQDPLTSLNTRRTVAENICRPMFNFGFDRGDALRRTFELLELVGLKPEHASRYPHQFSGGQCQRIAIARALALKPRFLFLDEPVSALDVSIQAQILNLLSDIRDQFNLTYLFVAHDLNVVQHFTDRAINLYHGRIVESGPSDALFSDPVHPYTKALHRSVLTLEGNDAWQASVEMSNEDLDDESVDVALAAAESGRQGCNYLVACPKSIGRCAEARPGPLSVGEGHHVWCHLAAPQPSIEAGDSTGTS